MIPSDQNNIPKSDNMSEYIVNQTFDSHTDNTPKEHINNNTSENAYKKPKLNFSMEDLNIDNNFDNSKKLSLNSSTNTTQMKQTIRIPMRVWVCRTVEGRDFQYRSLRNPTSHLALSLMGMCIPINQHIKYMILIQG